MPTIFVNIAVVDAPSKKPVVVDADDLCYVSKELLKNLIVINKIMKNRKQPMMLEMSKMQYFLLAWLLILIPYQSQWNPKNNCVRPTSATLSVGTRSATRFSRCPDYQSPLKNSSKKKPNSSNMSATRHRTASAVSYAIPIRFFGFVREQTSIQPSAKETFYKDISQPPI